MNHYGALASITCALLMFGCATSPSRNTTWFIDIPQGAVRFVFLPKNLGMVANGMPYSEVEIEATYKAASISGSDFIWVDQYNAQAYKAGRGDAAQAEIKIKTKIPPFEAMKEMVVDVYEPVPDEYKERLTGSQGRSTYGRINRNTFSTFMSKKISAKYAEINDEAKKIGAKLVLIKEYASYTNDVPAEGPWYRIYIHASIGNKSE